MIVSNNRIAGILILLSILTVSFNSSAQSGDSLAIHWVGHGTLYFEFDEKIIHVDPWSSLTDYSSLPDADLIFITHGHGDHYDLAALEAITHDSTITVCTQAVMNDGITSDSSVVLNNWDSTVVRDIPVKAVPAYNYEPGQIYHAKGNGNGYVLTFNDLKVFVAGDTEDVEEMAELGEIHIAFLPMNLPYTMTPEQAANAADMIKPNILYIYHFGDSDTAYFRSLVDDKIADIRIGEALRYERTTDLSFPTAINFRKLNSGIKIFPNPSENYLHVKDYSAETELHIYNTSGNLLISQRLENDGNTLLNLEFLNSGFYFLQLRSEEFFEHFTFVKL